MRANHPNILATVEGYAACTSGQAPLYTGNSDSRCQGAYVVYGHRSGIATNTKVCLDRSFEWRDRIVTINLAVSQDSYPSNAADNAESGIVPQMWDTNQIGAPTKYNQLVAMSGLWLPGAGWDEDTGFVDANPVARPYRRGVANGTPVFEDYYLYARNTADTATKGNLYFWNNSAQAVTVRVTWMALVSPPLNLKIAAP